MKTFTGPTPSGGDTCTAWFYDKYGGEVDGDDDAVETIEIVETRDDVVLARHYLERGTATPVFDDPLTAVGEPDEVDSTKMTWDLWIKDDAGQYKLIDTLDELLRGFNLDDKPLAVQRAEVASMTVLPSFEAAPPELTAEIAAWLETTRPAKPATD
jgi:hypothetical protein